MSYPQPRAASHRALGFPSATFLWARLRGSQIQEASLRERKCPSTPQPLERLPRAAPTTPPFACRPPQPREHPPPRDSLRGLDFDRHSAIFPGAGATPLSGPVADRTSDTSGGPRTSLPLDVRRPLWRRSVRKRGVECVRSGVLRGGASRGRRKSEPGRLLQRIFRSPP